MQNQLKFLLQLFMCLTDVVYILWADAQVLAFREYSYGAVRKCFHILFLIMPVGVISS